KLFLQYSIFQLERLIVAQASACQPFYDPNCKENTKVCELKFALQKRIMLNCEYSAIAEISQAFLETFSAIQYFSAGTPNCSASFSLPAFLCP
ncbi:MAG: hypothetical protein V1773_06960, partial [bacterium]